MLVVQQNFSYIHVKIIKILIFVCSGRLETKSAEVFTVWSDGTCHATLLVIIQGFGPLNSLESENFVLGALLTLLRLAIPVHRSPKN